MQHNTHTINALRDTLRKLVTDWTSDSCVPPNYIREDGLGNEIASVDIWAGRAQNPLNPIIIIGWDARGTHQDSGLNQGTVVVADFPAADVAIKYAKQEADKILVELGWKIDEPVTTQLTPVPARKILDALRDEFKCAVLDDGDDQANYESLAHMAYEKGYTVLAHVLDPDDYPLED